MVIGGYAYLVASLTFTERVHLELGQAKVATHEDR